MEFLLRNEQDEGIMLKKGQKIGAKRRGAPTFRISGTKRKLFKNCIISKWVCDTEMKYTDEDVEKKVRKKMFEKRLGKK